MCTYMHIYVIINAKKLIESSKAAFNFSLSLSLTPSYSFFYITRVYSFFYVISINYIYNLTLLLRIKEYFCRIGNIQLVTFGFPSLR